MPAGSHARLIHWLKLASSTASLTLFLRAVTKGNVLLAQGQEQTVLKALWVDFNRMGRMVEEEDRSEHLWSAAALFHINAVLFRAPDCSSISKNHFSPPQGWSYSTKAHKGIVLVHLGCYKKITQTGWLTNNRNYFSQFWRLESPRSKCQQDWVLVKALFPVHSWCLLTEWRKARNLQHGGKGRESLWSFFHKALISFMRVPPQDYSTSQTPSPNTITLRNRISAHEFWGDTNIQIIAGLVT